MNVREKIEKNERMMLSEKAVLSENSRGREHPQEQDETRTCFMRDRDRIIHSKAFRRLKHKTQVFISPEGDHYRTRLTHTLEVAQIARTIARGLSLNEDLVEAVSLGHDLGHTPFGHAGEKALDSVCPLGFSHNEQSLRVVKKIENGGRGINLTYEVMDGIVCHTGTKKADTIEGRIVHYADRIAYINHDIDDAVRAGVLKAESIPQSISAVLGSSHGGRIDSLVNAVISYGESMGDIGLLPQQEHAMVELRAFMFEAVYKNPLAKGEESKGIEVLKQLYAYFQKHIELLPEEYKLLTEQDGAERAICDYIAGMTDRFAVTTFQNLFIPKSWGVL